MKETGIIRRIDELGRVVIPKELRRVLRLKEGELMEIFTNERGELVLKKYKDIGVDKEQIQALGKVLYKTTGKQTFICDTDSIVAHFGGKEKLLGEEISQELYTVLDNRKSKHITQKPLTIAEDVAMDDSEQYVVPLVSSGDLYGGIVLSADKLISHDFAVCDALAEYLTQNISQ